MAYHFCQLRTKFLSNILLPWLAPYAKGIIGEYRCGFSTTGQLLIMYSAFVNTGEEMGIKRSSTSSLYKLQESL